MHALGNRFSAAGLVAGAAVLALGLGALGAGHVSAPGSPPKAPDAYEPVAEKPPPPLATALAMGDVSAAVEVVLEPREAIVQLRDGQRFTGFLVERNAQRIVLKIAGIETPIRSELVDRVIVLPPVRERYLSMRAAIDADDVDRLLLLVDWLRVREQWDLALYEVDQVLAAHPNHPEARRLRLLVVSQRDLAERARARQAAREGERNEEGEAERRHAEPRASGPRPDPDFPLLDEAAINLLRVYEIDLNNPPRIIIDRETITRFITRYGEHPAMPQTREGQAALYRASPARVLELMFRVRARDLYEEVRVLDHPRAMRSFRDDVHRSWVINSCATTRCHGGSEAGRLRLYNQRPNSDATVYTNFLILERFRLADGTPLINYEEPELSPLLHLGLPRDDSRYPHPPVPNAQGRGDSWRPVFRSRTDRRFQQATEWIMSMYRPRPEYPIEYDPPEGRASGAEPPIER